MITVKIIVSNPFQENTIVLSDQTKECIIIDAGGYTPQENKALSDYIESNGLKPVMAVNTHGHVDHMLGVNYVKERYGIPFAIDGRDAFLLSRPRRTERSTASKWIPCRRSTSTCKAKRRFVSAIPRWRLSRLRAIPRAISASTTKTRNC